MRFDVIGDIHGEFDKLTSLLGVLGYSETAGVWRHPQRTAVFVGDLIDRGPQQLETVGLVRGMVEAGAARCIPKRTANPKHHATAVARHRPAAGSAPPPPRSARSAAPETPARRSTPAAQSHAPPSATD